MAPSIQLATVIVNHNSAGHLAICLKTLSEHRGELSMEVVVVDHASTDGSDRPENAHGAHFIHSKENPGFGAGCNRGWRHTSAPCVFFLNPDARVQPGALTRAVALLDARPEVGIIGLRQEREDGSVLPGWGDDPNAWAEAWQKLIYNADTRSQGIRPALARRRYDHSCDVDWVSGAAMLVRRDLLQQLSGFDEEYFMYFEDVDLCRRARDAGSTVHYLADAGVYHAVGGCGDLDGERRRDLLRAGRRRFHAKFGGQAAD
ncbi:glycosyltransferase family 2 protein [bacterium AH-315-F18]|nr:glycosyltransferase family 2 protein [bacterium AH-315-F18]